jgi:hydrogenase maturation protease
LHFLRDAFPEAGSGAYVTARVVVGIGNPDRGDDAVGGFVASLLQSSVMPDIPVTLLNGEGAGIVAALEGVDEAWLVDAARSGASPGTIHRIDCVTDKIPPCGSVSSHDFGLAEAIELARALGTLPPQCVLYAIEAADFTLGVPLSPDVVAAAHTVAERIRQELIQPPP